MWEVQNPWSTTHTDLGIDDLALAGPGTGSAACTYHSRVGFRNIVGLAVIMHARFLRALAL